MEKPKLCRYCDKPLDKGRLYCKSCKQWNWDGPVGGTADDDGSLVFEEIEARELVRYKVGLLDTCLDGGLPITFVLLIAGLPGAGKSTILLQIAECLCVYGETLYIACEEDVKIIKERGTRLGCKFERRLRMLPAMGGVADIGGMLMTRRPKAIIVDSVDSLVGHDHEAEVEALRIIKKYAVELQAVAIIVSQVNKDEDFTGLMAKQHEVDVLMTLMPDADLKTDNGEAIRVAETLKNRGGRAFIETFYEMTGKGLQVCDVTHLAKPTKEQSRSEESEDDADED